MTDADWQKCVAKRCVNPKIPVVCQKTVTYYSVGYYIYSTRLLAKVVSKYQLYRTIIIRWGISWNTGVS